MAGDCVSYNTISGSAAKSLNLVHQAKSWYILRNVYEPRSVYGLLKDLFLAYLWDLKQIECVFAK